MSNSSDDPAAPAALLTRSVTDLIAAWHLTMHAYLNQAYSVMRSTLEAYDLIQLFGERPEVAVKWINSSASHQEFRPADVRERIGKPRFDEMYGMLSELGPHPRFRASRLTGYMRVPTGDSGELKRVHLRIGPFDADQLDLLLAVMLVLHQVAGLGIKMLWAAAISEDLTEKIWAETLVTSAGALVEAGRVLEAELAAIGVDDIPTIADECVNLRSHALTYLSEPPP